jgi:hypothetical protein
MDDIESQIDQFGVENGDQLKRVADATLVQLATLLSPVAKRTGDARLQDIASRTLSYIKESDSTMLELLNAASQAPQNANPSPQDVRMKQSQDLRDLQMQRMKHQIEQRAAMGNASLQLINSMMESLKNGSFASTNHPNASPATTANQPTADGTQPSTSGT